MSNDAKQFVEQIAAEADATADQPMPAAATSTRPNKSVTVATRMSPEDLHAIEALATELDLPVSALVRGWVLAGLNARKAESLTTALDWITADVLRLRELVARPLGRSRRWAPWRATPISMCTPPARTPPGLGSPRS